MNLLETWLSFIYLFSEQLIRQSGFHCCLHKSDKPLRKIRWSPKFGKRWPLFGAVLSDWIDNYFESFGYWEKCACCLFYLILFFWKPYPLLQSLCISSKRSCLCYGSTNVISRAFTCSALFSSPVSTNQEKKLSFQKQLSRHNCSLLAQVMRSLAS